jgi:hypothetical protein
LAIRLPEILFPALEASSALAVVLIALAAQQIQFLAMYS